MSNVINNVPELRFPDFSVDWELNKLDRIATFTSSKRVYLSDYTEVGIPFFRGKEISELKRGKEPTDVLYISEKAYIDLKKKYGVPKIDDILITAVGTLGNVLRIRDERPFYFKDGNLIWIKNIKVYSGFLETLLVVKNRDIQKTSIGSTQRALTMVELKKLSFVFPKMDEQQKIADFLSSVDKKIEQLTEKHRLLTEYKKGVIQQIFTQQIRFKDNNGNDYPEWEEKQLGNVAQITMGTSPSSVSYNEQGHGLPLIQGNADVSNRVSSPRIFTSVITKECFVGDVLLSVRAPVGEVSRSLHHACIGRGMSAVKVAKNNSTEFIYQFLLWFEPRWQSLSQGSTFESVNAKEIKELRVVTPCEEEQQKIANFLTEIDQKIDQAWSTLEQTKVFKKGLLQQMFV